MHCSQMNGTIVFTDPPGDNIQRRSCLLGAILKLNKIDVSYKLHIFVNGQGIGHKWCFVLENISNDTTEVFAPRGLRGLLT